MKQKMTEMHQKMQEQQEPPKPTYKTNSSPEVPKKSLPDDYIEYEEIK